MKSTTRKTLDEFAFTIPRVWRRVHVHATALGRLDVDIPNWVERSRRIRLHTRPWPRHQECLSAGGTRF